MIVKITWKRVFAAVTALFILSMGITWSGVINIGASTGHWAVTDWFLHWAMRNTVRTHAALESLATGRPGADPGDIVSAAGHYAATCASCHGAPGERPSPVMQSSTPRPPDLRLTAPEWTDAQLFWIIKHGVKFTAMPAWPDLERDDEIRRMAGFVRRLPGMSPAQYRELAYGPGRRVAGGTISALEAALPDCARCHGEDGHGRGQPDIPILAGQNSPYLLASLAAYASGQRGSGVMGAAAARLDPVAMRALAEHYAALPGLAWPERPVSVVSATAGDQIARQIATQGMPELDLPACRNCHGPGKRPDYPVLAGQKPEYLATRLRLWRQDENLVGARRPRAPMPVIAHRIPEHLIDDLAQYYAREGKP